jgi:shikimate dehydrogenase
MTHPKFGLIGYPLGHSLSPFIHDNLFLQRGLDYRYGLEEISPDKLDQVWDELLSEFQGFNVTIPHKKAMLKHMETLAPPALRCQAVNTVLRDRDGHCHGYNTDVLGFMARNFSYRDRDVLVLGTGGVAQTMVFSLIEMGAKTIYVRSRNLAKAEALVAYAKSKAPDQDLLAVDDAILAKGLEKAPDQGRIAPSYILNGTPRGMWPQVEGLPLEEALLRKFLDSPELLGLFDAIYNPLATRFLLLGKSYGKAVLSGLPMLFYQAYYAQEIWLNAGAKADEAPSQLSEHPFILDLMPYKVLESWPMKLILTGFMASGKSTIGKSLVSKIQEDYQRLLQESPVAYKGLPEDLNLRFVDLDEEIEKREGMPISDIFRTRGEAYFRAVESQVLSLILAEPGSVVLATGGGTLVDSHNVDEVRAAGGQIIYLDVPLEEALKRASDTSTRPLLQEDPDAIKRRYEARKSQYDAVSDLHVKADRPVSEVTDKILQSFGLVLKEA